MNYEDQLNDIRWKKRRVEILIRDRHTCQICEYIGPKVNVHHRKYTGMAWDAPDDDLITLCKSCHSKTHMPDINNKRVEELKIGNIIRKNYV